MINNQQVPRHAGNQAPQGLEPPANPYYATSPTMERVNGAITGETEQQQRQAYHQGQSDVMQAQQQEQVRATIVQLANDIAERRIGKQAVNAMVQAREIPPEVAQKAIAMAQQAMTAPTQGLGIA